MAYEIKVPEAGFSITEATVSEWVKSIGDKVEEGETVVSVDTDKINVEVPAEGSGILAEIRYQAGETAPVGEVLGIIAQEGEEIAAAPPKEKAVETPSDYVGVLSGAEPEGQVKTKPKSGKKPKMSPTAKAIARKEGIDLSEIPEGSGPGGRIVKSDVIAYMESLKKGPAAAKPAATAAPAPPQEKVPFTGWRKVIRERMTSSLRDAPHYNNAVEVDVTELAQVIKASREQKDGVKLTYLPFIMKAIQVGIDLVPEANAYCFEDGYVVQNDLNIGVAVDLGQKLLVPVVKNVREKTIAGLADDILKIVEKAREDKLDPEDIQGGTITLTNAGVYGIMYGTPIILRPQTTIMSLGAVREVPAVVNGSIEIRKRMIIVCSFDHSVVNGGPAARFLRDVKNNLEDPKKLMISMR